MDMHQKSLLILNQYAVLPSAAGGTRHYSLSKYLVRMGWAVRIVASFDSHMSAGKGQVTSENMKDVHDGVEFKWVRLPKYSGNSVARIWNMLYFAGLIFTLPFQSDWRRPSAILGSTPHLFGALSALILSKLLRVPFILEIRDLWPQTFVDLGAYSRYHPFVLLCLPIERILYCFADHIVTLLPGSEVHIIAKGGKASKISTISNGIDFELAKIPEVVDAGSRDRVQKEGILCVYGGALGLANSISTIIKTAEIIEKDFNDVSIHFDIYGEGPERAKLQEQAQGLRTLHFKGLLPKHEIYAKYLDADILLESKLDTDLYKYGVSFNKIFDYMACAKPIVIGLKADYDPVVAAGAGIQVRPEDPRQMAEAIVALARKTPEQRQEIGLRGRDYVKANFDFSNQAKKLAAIVEGL